MSEYAVNVSVLLGSARWVKPMRVKALDGERAAIVALVLFEPPVGHSGSLRVDVTCA
jgi:hypothetical protein